MLFDPRPKVSRSELFDREEELNALVNSTHPLTLLLGIRRIGKSSVLRVAVNELGGIYIDVRSLILNGNGWVSRSHLLGAFEKEVNRLARKNRGLVDRLRERVRGVRVAGVELRFTRKVSLIEVLEALDEQGTVIALDEAQLLRFSGSRGGRDFLYLIAYSYDNLRNTRFILSGSEVGLLLGFLGVDRYDSPLYGRSTKTITLLPFEREDSIRFLERGFEEQGIRMPRESLEYVASVLDGIPGWLVDFGVSYLEYRDLERALEEVFEKAKGFLRGELEKLGSRSRRYVEVLRAIALGNSRWSEIRAFLAARGDSVPKPRLSNILRNLEKMGWVTRRGDGQGLRYYNADPVIERVLRSL